MCLVRRGLAFHSVMLMLTQLVHYQVRRSLFERPSLRSPWPSVSLSHLRPSVSAQVRQVVAGARGGRELRWPLSCTSGVVPSRGTHLLRAPRALCKARASKREGVNTVLSV
jgi:hypothetical protein